MNSMFRSNPISGFLRKAAAFVGLTSMVLGGGAVSALADNSVSFNNLSGDLPTLQVGQTGGGWGSTTAAKPGDTVSLMVWDHNTNPDAVASNVTIQVSLPTGFATTFTPTATVSADGAQPAHGSATITSSTTAKLAYIPGSARFYRYDDNSQPTQVSFPSGVNPDDIVAGGINLGQQAGCWQNAQMVIIQVQLQAGNPAFTTNKKVAPFGSGSYGDTATDQPGDIDAFRIFVQNTGTSVATNVKVTDKLDSHYTYVPGTSTVRTKVNNKDVDTAYPDSNIVKNGQTLTWSFPDMQPDPAAAFYLTFQARLTDKTGFPVGDTTLKNCANVTATGGLNVSTNCVTITVNRAVDQVVTFSMNKQISYTGSNWLPQAVGVAPGSKVRYRIQFQNTGNTPAQNVYIKDILPAGITDAGNAKIYNSAHPSGLAIDESSLFTSTGYLIPTLVNGTDGTQAIEFDALVTAACAGTPTLTNTSKLFYNNKLGAQATADALLSCTKGLAIVKDIQDPTDGKFKDTIGVVREDQVLTYRIVVTNTGNTTVTHPTLRDILPAFTTYVNNSMTIDGEFMSQAVQNNFLSAAGVTLTDFTPGMSKEIRFQVKTVSCPNLGDTKIVNTAHVKGDSVADISDTATATLRVDKPVLAPVF